MTMNAERDTIGYLKSVGWMNRPFSDVMCMKIGLAATILADIVITLENRVTPFFQLLRQAGAFAVHRFAILEGVSGLLSSGARNGAICLAALICGEDDAAFWAYLAGGRIPPVPTFPRAKASGIAPIVENIKSCAANVTEERHPPSSVLAAVGKKTRYGAITLLLGVWVKCLSAMLADIGLFQSCAHKGIIAWYAV